MDKYNDIFQNQLKHNIIEEVKIYPKDYYKFHFIPHRPVVEKTLELLLK